jgi:hypothetical protein
MSRGEVHPSRTTLASEVSRTEHPRFAMLRYLDNFKADNCMTIPDDTRNLLNQVRNRE